VKSNARWEWSEAKRVGARDERIDLIMGWNPNPGKRRIKRELWRHKQKGKRENRLSEAKSILLDFRARAGLLRYISFFIRLIG
jgi:hypothetical protein